MPELIQIKMAVAGRQTAQDHKLHQIKYCPCRKLSTKKCLNKELSALKKLIFNKYLDETEHLFIKKLYNSTVIKLRVLYG